MKINKILIFMIDAFWPIFRCIGCCRYTINCSQYAKLMLEQEPLDRALWLTAKRICSCHPFGKCS